MSSHSEVVTNFGAGKKTLHACVMGFVLSILLTLMAFSIVWEHHWSAEAMYISLAMLAVTQLLVQVVFFLRMNTSR